MRFRAHSTCWTNILERKMLISIKFEPLNVRMPTRIYCSFGPLFLLFYKMNSQSGETVEQRKETIKNGKKKWTDDEVQDLIELPEEKPYLWDIFFEYTKREVKERAYAELTENFQKQHNNVITMKPLHFLNIGPTCWTRFPLPLVLHHSQVNK